METEELQIHLENILRQTREHPGLAILSVASTIVDVFEEDETEILIKNLKALNK